MPATLTERELKAKLRSHSRVSPREACEDTLDEAPKGFEAHLVLVRAVLESGQHAPYLIALELPVLAPTKFADTYVLSGTFPLPLSWNRPGPVLDVRRLAVDIAKAGGASEDCEMIAPLEPVATADDREISLGEGKLVSGHTDGHVRVWR